MKPQPSVNRLALSATLHCLTGCSIGEVLGMATGSVLGWSNLPTVILSVLLAFLFGYALTIRPLRRARIPSWPGSKARGKVMPGASTFHMLGWRVRVGEAPAAP